MQGGAWDGRWAVAVFPESVATCRPTASGAVAVAEHSVVLRDCAEALKDDARRRAAAGRHGPSSWASTLARRLAVRRHMQANSTVTLNAPPWGLPLPQGVLGTVSDLLCEVGHPVLIPFFCLFWFDSYC